MSDTVSELPQSITERCDQVAELHIAHPVTEVTDVTHLLVETLHIAVYGDTWARPESPRQVWEGLLRSVIDMRAARAQGTG